MKIIKFDAQDVIATSGLCANLSASYWFVTSYENNCCDFTVYTSHNDGTKLINKGDGWANFTYVSENINSTGWYHVESESNWSFCSDQSDAAHPKQ